MKDTATTSVGSQRATAREFFAVVFRRRWVILGLFLATTATVVVVSLGTPVLYLSAGQVLVRRGEQMSVLSPDRRLMNDWETELASEVQTAKSWPVLQRAQRILDEEATGQPSPRIQSGQVDAEVTGKSNVLAIAYADRDPEVAQRVCDALIRGYIDYRQGSQMSYPRRFFDGEIGRAQGELERWMELRRQFANQTGTVDLPEQRRNALYLRATLEQKRTDLAASLAETQSEQRLMRQLRDRPDVDLPAMGVPTLSDNVLSEIKRRMVEQQSRIAVLRERYRDESVEVTNARATLDTLRGMLAREVDGRLAVTQSRAEVVQSRFDVMQRDIAVLERQLEGMPDKEARLAEMDYEIASWKSRYDELVKSSDQARVNENTSPLITVYVLNPAGPARPRNARDYVRLALAPAFSLVVGIGLAFFIDGLDLTVRTAGQAEEEVRVPVLAALTERKKGGRRSHRHDPEKTPA